MPEIPESDTPENLRPDLTSLGISEYDRGICVDNYENRKILRAHQLSWTAIFDVQGNPDPNLIQAISPEMSAAASGTGLDMRKPIMVDATEPEKSDYITGITLALHPQANELAPGWVVAAARLWHLYTQKPELKTDRRLVGPPQRCRFIKTDRVRCMLWASGRDDNDGYCRTHMRTTARGDGAGMAMVRTRNRLREATMSAMDALENLMVNAESDAVKVRAAENILDRAGIRGGVELDITHTTVKPAADVIRERIERFQSNAKELAALQAAEAEDEIIAVPVEDEDETND